MPYFYKRNMFYTFQLYLLINEDAVIRYPYVAISPEVKRVLFISEQQVNLLDPSDLIFFESDYLPTSRFVQFDLLLLDTLVQTYTGQQEYSIITRFTAEKHITLTYHSPTNERPKEYDIFTGYPDARAEKLVEEIYPLMNAVKEMVFAD